MKRKIIIFIICVLIMIIIIPKKEKNIDNNVENNLNSIQSDKVENMLNKNETNNVSSENVILNDNESNIKIAKAEVDFSKKTIAFIGDSLVEGYGNDFRGFDYYLKNELPDTKFINNSKSGSTITDNSGSDNIVMINQAKTLSGNPDIIAFDGGANDIMGYALGFLNNELKKEIGNVDSKKGVSSNDSVINDLEETINELKNRFPNAKLCYIQPFLLDDETVENLTQDENGRNEIKSRRDTFYAEVQKLCEKWNIKYVDVSDTFSGTGLTYRQSDWIHIKESGYKLLTPYILEGLKKIYE